MVQYPATQEEVDALAQMWIVDDPIGEQLNFSWSVKGVAKKDQVEGMTELMAHCADNRVSNNYLEYILSNDRGKVYFITSRMSLHVSSSMEVTERKRLSKRWSRGKEQGSAWSILAG